MLEKVGLYINDQFVDARDKLFTLIESLGKKNDTQVVAVIKSAKRTINSSETSTSAGKRKKQSLISDLSDLENKYAENLLIAAIENEINHGNSDRCLRASDRTKIRNDIISMIRGAKAGWESKERLDERAIEAMIQAVTPEADEKTRQVQRHAASFLPDPRPGHSQRHLDNMMKAAEDWAN